MVSSPGGIGADIYLLENTPTLNISLRFYPALIFGKEWHVPRLGRWVWIFYPDVEEVTLENAPEVRKKLGKSAHLLIQVTHQMMWQEGHTLFLGEVTKCMVIKSQKSIELVLFRWLFYA